MPLRSLRFVLPALSLFAATMAIGTQPASAAIAPVCTGKNLYEELKQEQPKLAEKVKADAATQPYGKGLFFKAEKDGAAPSYIMGTMHITDPRLQNLPPKVQTAFDGADTLALEIIEILDPAKMATASAQNMGMTMYLDANNLDTKLQGEQRDVVRQFALEKGLPWNIASRMRPFFLMAMLSLPDCERRRANSGKLFLDHALGKSAKDTGKQLVGLETFKDQLKAIGDLPEDLKLKSLVDTARMADRIPDMFETMVDLYTKGQTGLIWALMHVSGPNGYTDGADRTDFSEFQRIMIDRRNATMAEASAPLIDKGNAFIAVGALHLPGEEGLLNLLAKRGYAITPIE